MEPAKSAEQRFRERQELFKKLWAENQWLYVFWGIAIGVLITAVASGNESVLDVLVSFAPEFVGLLFVTVVLDRRAKYREREQRKQQLIRDIRSRSNDFALRAVNELRHERWLTDGTLQNADLLRANLQNAILVAANLQNARLLSANLQNAELGGAELQGAGFYGSDFNEKTLLPDGSYFGPQQGPEQLERFTNSNHPDFWRSDLRSSPAYRGDLETTGDE